MYERLVAVAAPTKPYEGINNKLPEMLTITTTEEVYIFNSGRPLAAISFARILAPDPASIPGNKNSKGMTAPR